MARRILATLLLITPVVLLLALLAGSSTVGAGELLALLQGESDPGAARIFTLRAWRAYNGFVVGAELALAGALLQVLLRNPLAEPYILGISGGAGTLTLAGLLLGLGTAWMPVTAFAGALLAMLLVFGIGFSRGSWTPLRLLLTGVVIAAGWNACISFLLALSTQRQVHGMLFWLMGDLGQAGNALLPGGIMLAGLLASWVFARPLNLLAHGELHATALGVGVTGLQRWLFLIASGLTATAVSTAGSIGFIGLIVPHLLRLLGLRDHRLLLPAAALAGGSFLVLADTLARTLLAPRQIPVGVVTALIGVPLFLLLLQRQYGYRAAKGGSDASRPPL